MKKKPVFIAFSTQKGGVGKTTFTVLTASYLHYACGYNLIVVDCDYPQFSINAMRQRDAQGVDRNPALQELAATQFSELQKPTYNHPLCHGRGSRGYGQGISGDARVGYGFRLF